jgi:transposase-like protein
LWSEALAERDAEMRRGLIAHLGVSELGRLGRRVDLYRDDHDDDLEATFLLLDEAGVLGELTDAWSHAVANDADDHPAVEDFLALLTARLARISRSSSEQQDEAHRLFRFWRKQLYERHERDVQTLTVAETAALFGVSPQAVYKWIRRGTVETVDSDDHKTRISVESLNLNRDQQRAIDALKESLYGDAPVPNELPEGTVDALARIARDI